MKAVDEIAAIFGALGHEIRKVPVRHDMRWFQVARRAGLDRGSVVTDRKALRARVAAMTEQFDEVLVQEYVAGREFNVGLVGTRTLPISEIDFARMPEGAWPILTYAAKWDVGSADDLGRPHVPL